MWNIRNAFLCLLFATLAYVVKLSLDDTLPDAGMTTEEQVQLYGYPFENHLITTEDNYILTAHRIPHGKSTNTTDRPVVLLMPGIWRSSEVWVNFGPQRSLGFILADSGFDVWLGNYRGTTWSRRHVKLDPDQNTKQFWNYSLDELGYYDCPAFIDYILKTTGRSTLIYVGETIGATMFFIMGAEKPNYLTKVPLMVAIAPMVDIGKPTNLLYNTVAFNKNTLQTLADYFGAYEVLQHSKASTNFLIRACGDFLLREICQIVHSFGVGFDSSQLNKTAIPLLLNGFPAGSSLKQLIHLSQMYETGGFAKYDYGKKENQKRYGQVAPPVYDVGKITTPVALYYGENDALVDKKGVERFSTRLPNITSMKYVTLFNNGDFLWAKDVVNLIYTDLIKLMKTYQKPSTN